MPSVNLADYKGQFGPFHRRMLLDDGRNEIRIAFCCKSAKIGSACFFLNSGAYLSHTNRKSLIE